MVMITDGGRSGGTPPGACHSVGIESKAGLRSTWIGTDRWKERRQGDGTVPNPFIGGDSESTKRCALAVVSLG